MRDKLIRLAELEHEMRSDEEHRALHNYLLGSLAAQVTNKVWDQALKIAKECIEKYPR